MGLGSWLSVLKAIGPAVVATLVPGGALIAPIVVAAVGAAERLPGAAGPEKKAAALELVDAGVQAFNLANKRKRVDRTEARNAADNAIDAVVAATNMITERVPAIPDGDG